MPSVDPAPLRDTANECVLLVRAQLGRDLDGTLDGLDALDEVCARLTADGPLVGARLDLWCKLVGAYLGEVVVRAHGGTWIAAPRGSDPYAVRIGRITGFPFTLAGRVLSAEPFKSLASFARSFPAIEAAGSPDQSPTGPDPSLDL